MNMYNETITWLEDKYIKLAGMNLPRFHQVAVNTYNFRCIVCGDSQKNDHKCRGFIFERDGKHFYYCHNCGASMKFSYFLRTHFPSLYSQYMIEYLKEAGGPIQYESSIPRANKWHPETTPYEVDPMVNTESILDLESSHPAKMYIESRKIPVMHYSRIFYTDNFFEFASEFNPERYSRDESKPKEPRILFPFRNAQNNVFAVSGRYLGDLPPEKSQLRYMTLRSGKHADFKCYGLDVYDPNVDGYCTEGMIDSLFLPNCLAFAGLGKIRKNTLPFNPEKITFVLDNEPRNRDVCSAMDSCIRLGGKVCIWPEWFSYKDINDAVMSERFTIQEIRDLIRESTYSGDVAKAKLMVWRKV